MSKVIQISPDLRNAIREEVTAAIRDALAQQAPVLAAVDRAMRLPEVMRTCALSRSSIYALIAQGEFPAGFLVGPNARAWLLSEVQAWIAARVAARSAA